MWTQWSREPGERYTIVKVGERFSEAA